jgi:hypothetical protein
MARSRDGPPVIAPGDVVGPPVAGHLIRDLCGRGLRKRPGRGGLALDGSTPATYYRGGAAASIDRPEAA